MSIHIINISMENWASCDKDKIFGIPVTEKSWPRLRKGNLVLVRWALTKTKPCGCIAIWEFERDQEVPPEKRTGSNEIIPWSDNAYRLKQHFRQLARFEKPFDEGFGGRSKYSEKLGWQIQRLRGSILELTRAECARYIGFLLKEKAQEIPAEVAERLKESCS